MSEMLDELTKLKEKIENYFEGNSEEEDTSLKVLQVKAFLGMLDFLHQKTVDESIGLVDTILEGDDLKKEVTIMHENSFKDMDKVFELLGKAIPPETVKLEQITKNVNKTLEFIKEIRAIKKAANA